ncbi:TPA: hypothetical protein HA251_04960 [Candidatus Woesearchaeota archaeon]|nr:hypothetical protein [Candidatus Woesearchaeota archaeon]
MTLETLLHAWSASPCAKNFSNAVYRTARCSLLFGVAYAATVLVSGYGIRRDAPTLTHDQVIAAVNVEKHRFGLDDKTIRVTFTGPDTIKASAGLRFDGTYEITLSPDNCILPLVRHEMYHIGAGHCDDAHKRALNSDDHIVPMLRYLFINEPQAILYSSLADKL